MPEIKELKIMIILTKDWSTNVWGDLSPYETTVPVMFISSSPPPFFSLSHLLFPSILISIPLLLPPLFLPQSLFIQWSIFPRRFMSSSSQQLNTFQLPNRPERKSVMYRVGFTFLSISDICVLCLFSNDVKYLLPFSRGAGFRFCYFGKRIMVFLICWHEHEQKETNREW